MEGLWVLLFWVRDARLGLSVLVRSVMVTVASEQGKSGRSWERIDMLKGDQQVLID